MWNIYSFEAQRRNTTEENRKHIKELRLKDKRKSQVADLADRYSTRVKDFIQNYPLQHN
jgi:hypothetical protein